MNPGLSAKDRIAIHMIDKAEKEGRLKPGGTIIEATSGNTGFSIAMISAIRGYRCILTVTSKISQERSWLGTWGLHHRTENRPINTFC